MIEEENITEREIEENGIYNFQSENMEISQELAESGEMADLDQEDQDREDYPDHMSDGYSEEMSENEDEIFEEDGEDDVYNPDYESEEDIIYDGEEEEGMLEEGPREPNPIKTFSVDKTAFLQFRKNSKLVEKQLKKYPLGGERANPSDISNLYLLDEQKSVMIENIQKLYKRETEIYSKGQIKKTLNFFNSLETRFASITTGLSSGGTGTHTAARDRGVDDFSR